MNSGGTPSIPLPPFVFISLLAPKGSEAISLFGSPCSRLATLSLSLRVAILLLLLLAETMRAITQSFVAKMV